MQLRITIDTREQAPWMFPPEVATTSRGTLAAGDYALEGDGGFAVERKSLSDFVSTITREWDRFGRELQRMAEMWFPARIIIVEADYHEIIDREYPGMCQPGFVIRRIAELSMMGVSVLFASSSIQAAGLAYSIFKRRYEQIRRNLNWDSSGEAAGAGVGVPETGQHVDDPRPTPRHIDEKMRRKRRDQVRAETRRPIETDRELEEVGL
jgi:ERCC4-type nuclease